MITPLNPNVRKCELTPTTLLEALIACRSERGKIGTLLVVAPDLEEKALTCLTCELPGPGGVVSDPKKFYAVATDLLPGTWIVLTKDEVPHEFLAS